MYENMSNIELYSRLHFLENHTRYQADELAKKQHKIDEQAEEIKELKTELNRITEFLKLAGKKYTVHRPKSSAKITDSSVSLKKKKPRRISPRNIIKQE